MPRGGSNNEKSQLPAGASPFAEYDASAANTENTETLSAVSGKKHYLTGFKVVISGAAVGASGVTIQVKDGTTEVHRDMVPASSVIGSSIVSEPGEPIVIGTTNTDMVIVVSAGGAGAITHLSYWGYTL